MNRSLIAALLATLFVSSLGAQNRYEWTVLTSSPMQTGRYEDISFINPQQGWAVSGTSTLIRTNNGGATWDVLQAAAPFNVYFRCVSLVSPTKAFIGTLNASNPLIVTPNSGKSFSSVAVSGKKPTKVCGLFRYQNSIYGVGGYDGNATLVRSTDAGATWTGVDMTPYAVSLVDCHFFNDSTGLTIGSAKGSTYNNGHAVVLRTTDRGESWQNVFTSARTGEWGWKLFFLNDSVGFVSIERRSPSATGIFYLKTMDRGMTWTEHFFLQDYDVEGIGFWDESTGWIGGWTGPTYQTTDSGRTWGEFSLSNKMSNLNRVRRINDTLMYGAGTQIFRYAPSSPASVERINSAAPAIVSVAQNYPNPFNPNTTIVFTLSEFSTVRISIFNAVGQLVEGIMDNPKPAGTYRLQWQPSPGLSGGVYFFRLQTESHTITRSMLYLK
jgi:photosystem II stability/assembly factor-like uncharacterized protein